MINHAVDVLVGVEFDMVNSGLWRVDNPSVRVRLISKTRSKPPTTKRFK